MMSSWHAGHVVAVWNGDGRVDFNWFLFGIDEDIPYMVIEMCETTMTGVLQSKQIVKDEFPRGVGRVVNIIEEYEDRDEEPPIWF